MKKVETWREISHPSYSKSYFPVFPFLQLAFLHLVESGYFTYINNGKDDGKFLIDFQEQITFFGDFGCLLALTTGVKPAIP